MQEPFVPDASFLCDWATLDPAIPAVRRLSTVVAEVASWETDVPVDLAAFKLRENSEEYREGAHAAIIGPMPPRGPATGLVVLRGRVAASWGEPDRQDIAFSVTKSFLSTLAGVALADGRIPALDSRVADTVAAAEFAAPFNDRVTWRHLLTLTSEWRGSLWGIPDSIDWHRRAPKRPDDPPKGTPRAMQEPGTLWEFNDVRVNVLAFALTHVFGEPLGPVLKCSVMDAIGACTDWTWHGYGNASTMIGGRSVLVVSGGAHWGGGMIASSYDLARLALLYNRRGRWDGTTVLPDSWFDAVRSATPAHPEFGLMWWLNTARTIPALSPQAIWGSGISNLLVADPLHDLVVVLRWYDVPRRNALLQKIVDAVAPAGGRT